MLALRGFGRAAGVGIVGSVAGGLGHAVAGESAGDEGDGNVAQFGWGVAECGKFVEESAGLGALGFDQVGGESVALHVAARILGQGCGCGSVDEAEQL